MEWVEEVQHRLLPYGHDDHGSGGQKAGRHAEPQIKEETERALESPEDTRGRTIKQIYFDEFLFQSPHSAKIACPPGGENFPGARAHRPFDDEKESARFFPVEFNFEWRWQAGEGRFSGRGIDFAFPKADGYDRRNDSGCERDSGWSYPQLWGKRERKKS
jgi:hypothetical protein